MTFFTEEGGVDNSRFTVAGFDLTQSLPHGGDGWRLDLPVQPTARRTVAASVGTRPVDAKAANTDGLRRSQADVEQPVEFWSGVAALRASCTPTTTSATRSARRLHRAGSTPVGSAELSPWTPIAHSLRREWYERYNTHERRREPHDALRVNGPRAIGGHVTLKGGYDGRSLDRRAAPTSTRASSTAQALVKAGDCFQARIGREQNVQGRRLFDVSRPDDAGGAAGRSKPDTSLFYTQRISDSAIVPVGDFATTGFSQIGTKGELNVGVESHVQDNKTAHERLPGRARHQRPGRVRDDRRAHAREARPRARHQLRPRTRAARQAVPTTATPADCSQSTGCRPTGSRRRPGTKRVTGTDTRACSRPAPPRDSTQEFTGLTRIQWTSCG